jgi:hypothetical protein
MANRQHYRASDATWATSAEVVVNDPVAGELLQLRLSVESDATSQFVVFAASTPAGRFAPFLDAKLRIHDEDRRPLRLDDGDPTHFFSQDGQIAILVHPNGRSWTAYIEQGTVPFSVSAFAFHPAVLAIDSAAAMTPSSKCRFCKTVSKALAVAIVAAAGAAVLPAALLASVGAFLGGIGTVAAAAFINSVIGDTADVVAEKLCLAIRLCP